MLTTIALISNYINSMWWFSRNYFGTLQLCNFNMFTINNSGAPARIKKITFNFFWLGSFWWDYHYSEISKSGLSWKPFNCSSYVKTKPLLTGFAEETGNLLGHNMQLFVNYPIINTPTANWKDGKWKKTIVVFNQIFYF